jgi:hypothetical protein
MIGSLMVDLANAGLANLETYLLGKPVHQMVGFSTILINDI